MNENTSWKSTDIHKVNNYLIIKGKQLLKTSNDPGRVYRACYALPSDPEKMDDWVYRHLNETEAQQLFDFCFHSNQ